MTFEPNEACAFEILASNLEANTNKKQQRERLWMRNPPGKELPLVGNISIWMQAAKQQEIKEQPKGKGTFRLINLFMCVNTQPSVRIIAETCFCK